MKNKEWMVLAACIFVFFGMTACSGNKGNMKDSFNELNDIMQEVQDTGDAGDSAKETADVCIQPVPQDAPSLTQKKFALSMFHFNIQYVAGGLKTVWDGKPLTLCENLGFLPAEACMDWDEQKLSDWEIDVAFEPTLDLFIKHPEWKATFEIPGIMLEVIGERHPDALEKLRKASLSGQIELVSFHWSAQLFIAFPKLDLMRSLDMTRKVFEKYCLPLSGVVFNQEGIDGEGKHAFMAENGFTTDVMHLNQFGYVHWQKTIWPYYKDHGIAVVVGPPLIDGNAGIDPESGIDVKWTFFDDGELLSVPADPYFAPVCPEPDAANIAKFEENVKALADQGYKITHLTDFVNHMKAQGIKQPDLPPILDGTWQPIDTDSIHLWLGARGQFPWAVHERDNYIRTTSFMRSRELAAAEIIVGESGKAGADTISAKVKIEQAWKHLLKAEVSDATGINPFEGEFNYAKDNNEAVKGIVDEVFAEMLSFLKWKHAEIDLEKGTAAKLDDLPQPETLKETAAPFEIIVDAPTRKSEVHWYGGSEKYELHVDFSASADPVATDIEKCRITATFPGYEDKIIYTPALWEDNIVEYAFTEFQFHPAKDYKSGTQDVYIPLSNGLIGLGNGWWVIRDNRTVMIAPRIPVSGSDKIIQFIDETADPASSQTWVFHVIKGKKEDALKLATQLNIKPVVRR